MHVNQQAALRRHIESALPELEVLLGWEQGYEPLRTSPLFVRSPRDLARLIWSPFCVQNLTGYLVKPPAVELSDNTKRIGICVRGCDSRSLIALMQEKFVEREHLHIIGLPCQGTVDWKRVHRKASLVNVRSASIEGDTLLVTDARDTHHFPLQSVLARRCLRCRYPNPLIYDELIGETVESRVGASNAWQDVQAIEALSLEERLAFWRKELDRCIRCYACRNACPLCVCQDRCIAEARDPKWMTQRLNLPEKFMFHFIHALHLAGRCTECGECERVCPSEIPVALMKEKLNRIALELLEYEAGIDPKAVPPLLTFNEAEAGI